MKYQLSFILLLSFISCGPQADRIKVNSKLPPVRSLNFLSPENFQFDSEMRNASLVIYPNVEEMVNVSFDPVGKNEELEQSNWAKVLTHLSYRDRLPRGLKANESNHDKLLTTTRIILSMGEAMDLLYRQAGILSLELEKKLKEVKAMQSDLVAKYPCFYPTENESGRICEIVGHPGDPNPPVEMASDCATLKDWKFNFTGPDLEKFSTDVNVCFNTVKENQKSRREITNKKIAPLLETRKIAKGIVTNLLEKIKLHSSNRLLTIATTEDPSNDGEKSIIEFGESNKKVVNFALLLDSGSNHKLYTIENNGIQNLKWFKNEDGFWVLSFKLVDDLFQIEAKLSATVVNIFGLRLVGDVVYKEGAITRKGVMKLEFNSQSI